MALSRECRRFTPFFCGNSSMLKSRYPVFENCSPTRCPLGNNATPLVLAIVVSKPDSPNPLRRWVSLGEPSQTVETTRWLTSTGWAQWTQLLKVLTRWRLLTAELRRGSLGRDVRSLVASHLPCRQ